MILRCVPCQEMSMDCLTVRGAQTCPVPYASCEESGVTPKSAGGNGVGNKDMFLMRDEMSRIKLCSKGETYTLMLQRKSL